MGLQGSIEGGSRTLRAWQLALLRYAVTLDHADRMNVMAIAKEIDRGRRRAREFLFLPQDQRRSVRGHPAAGRSCRCRPAAVSRADRGRSSQTRIRRRDRDGSSSAPGEEAEKAERRQRVVARACPAQQCCVWCAVISHPACPRTSALRAMPVRDRACSDLPGGTSSSARNGTGTETSSANGSHCARRLRARLRSCDAPAYALRLSSRRELAIQTSSDRSRRMPRSSSSRRIRRTFALAIASISMFK